MYNELLLPDLRMMLEENDTNGLKEFCEVLHAAVTAEVLNALEDAAVWRVLENCSLARQVEIFEFLDLSKQVNLVRIADRERLSRLLEEMAPDNRVDLLSRMSENEVDDLLPLLAKAERNDIRKLLSFPVRSAGAIMTTDYASLPENITVRDALDRLRKQAPKRETIYYVYILDDERRLDGFLTLEDLILAKPDKVLSEIMTRPVISVRVDDNQETVAQELARYDFLAIPVVDNLNHLVGIVTYDDVLDVVQAEATEDAQRLGAVAPFEDSYLTTSLVTLYWKRGVWLVVLLAAALGTAGVLKYFESVSDQSRWMILFIPMVLASGGNAGSQSATLVIRMLALGEMRRREHVLLARRELVLGAALGTSLMLLGIVFALLFVEPQQAIAVGMTVLLIVLLATFTGSMLPLGLQRLGMDPALMSNPLISALVDMMGVVIYYNVAMLVLG